MTARAVTIRIPGEPGFTTSYWAFVVPGVKYRLSAKGEFEEAK